MRQDPARRQGPFEGSFRQRRSAVLRAVAAGEAVAAEVDAEAVQALERDGLVVRQAFPEVPPRVEYSLTPLGSTLRALVCGLVEWSGAHLPEVDAARAAYDARNGKHT